MKIGVIDLVYKAPTNAIYSKVMHANFTSIMPQVVAVWCEQEGHDVQFFCYTGFENLEKELPEDAEIVFICGFTQSALLAYAISNKLRSSGIITVLGGPHARCYPDDALKYFDYVAGFTNKDVILEILRGAEKQYPIGVHLSADCQLDNFPGFRERWKFIEPILKKAPFIKIVPMLSSIGCVYSCPFCIDASVPYSTLNSDAIKEDLRFIASMKKRPLVGWHDPNFGIQFSKTLDVIEDAVKPGTLRFIAESSFSVLTEKNLQRMSKNGFIALVPGIESWFEMGKKSKSGGNTGLEKVKKMAAHIELVNGYIPYLQTNMIFGHDSDVGSAPFELTKKFVDLTPGNLGAFTLLTAYGEAAPINLIYQKENRILPFPFNFLNNGQAMNVVPKNYDWITFYDHIIDLYEYSFSWKAILKRLAANNNATAKWLNFVRAISREGFGRIKYLKTIRYNLINDNSFRDYFEGNTTKLPQFYHTIIKKELGYMYKWLPKGAIYHDHKAYLRKQKLGAVCT
ncbi:MAG: hypothetical protein KAQ62_25575 [Cyclobacteriaceae bacterium]|nr:hypothetical protein [Cyclobacteriaceae bacterium]